MKYNRNVAIIYRLTAFVVVVIGLTLDFLAEATVVDKLNKLCFFTIQSNIFVAVLLGVLLIGVVVQRIKDGKYGEVYSLKSQSLQMAVIFYITVTFLFFAFFLALPQLILTYSEPNVVQKYFISFCLHFVLPVMIILDWIYFAPHGNKSKKLIFWYMLYPLVYFVLIILRATSGTLMVEDGAYTSRYPYPFVDIDLLGWWALLVIPFVVGLLMLLAYGMIQLDNRLAKVFAAKIEKQNSDIDLNKKE